ncbi:uncharacterized protein LOC132279462 [Cornus florida]|uniref:uncharacterized protein LOC132279462 n=1 Tax=Cornus florida TaxID=4283 RepID=UPI0028A27B69|nr:uncharacterized protein LOC132279462 [Cornus florida]XP_059637428.1 uncharacterized protein LOC132279462 [Cornus florida]
MDLRSCSQLHFIQAIVGGLVIKVRNADSHGRPALVFKKLRDIYESEDAKNPNPVSTLKTHDRYAENLCLPKAERKMKRRVLETDEFSCSVSDNETDNDLDDVSFGKITLRQLKERCKTKKRKVSESVCLTPTQDNSTLQLEEDEIDLMKTLNCWKSKLSKNLMVKKKCAKKHVSMSSENAFSVKSEQITSAVESLHSGGDLPTPVSVKVEVSRSEHGACQNMTDVPDDSFSESVGLTPAQDNSIMQPEEDDLDLKESLNCWKSKLSKNLMVKKKYAKKHVSMSSENVFSVNSEQITSAVEPLQSGVDFPTPVGVKVEVFVPDNSSIGCNEQEVFCQAVSTENMETVNCEKKIMEPASLTEECQNCILNEVSFDYVVPERLLSPRKVISPTSQERLCEAMDSVELNTDIKHYKCKWKLSLGKQTENKTSSVESDLDNAEVTINPEGPKQFNRKKVTVNPMQINKLNNDKKGSPPKSTVKDSCLQRSPPHGSTYTSVKNCSESAIAFSQRQMHDIESLATKLMKELKFMKDIVEGKLLSDASPSPTVPTEYHEVKEAIKNATKVEETSRRWLSMMGRDCNRFCKIMRLSEKNAAAPENAIHKERKKITFADEAGGELCHVKIFEDDIAFPDCESETQVLDSHTSGANC